MVLQATSDSFGVHTSGVHVICTVSESIGKSHSCAMSPDVDSSGILVRMKSTVAAILPQISSTIAERTLPGHARIDLSTAENWLLRPELVKICQDAIADTLTAKVKPCRFVACGL